ncbi:type I restriction enzyme HsdR N-terminal domain-containing protein [Endozoicomonas ascidiicola]|uniref:type I restriction enzyme HsdR N-terminal domain-containing protein n=1 Tax=Endozoicomonas ascidiicola TaxID=1698521 RepID=UPI000831E443|nr:type I restriction enzyme HsdR N-terminal domain-containing protein [Endozoicomonas ascidiicola]
MAKIPQKVKNRLVSSIPKFKKILTQGKERDVNESDTVTIITDMLEEVFGFDKYSEITREFSIKGTYCDLAIKNGDKVEYLIEVKAIGISLKEKHLKQAINYAAGAGITWVVITNGLDWEVHKVTVKGKVSNEQVFSFNVQDLNLKKSDHLEMLFSLCKRGIEIDLIDDLYQYKQSVNRYTVGAILLSESTLNFVGRELKRLNSGIKVNSEELASILEHEILKRDLIDSEEVLKAQKMILKQKKSKNSRKDKALNTALPAPNMPILGIKPGVVSSGTNSSQYSS